MKKCVSILCLMIYLLFGFFNTGCVGFCTGSDVSKHLGFNIFGYETCCHHKELSKKSSSINSSNKILNVCKCNDIFAQTLDIVQNFDIQIFDFSNINIYTQYPQLIAYYINSTNKIETKNIYSNIYLSSNRIKIKSTVLKI